MKITGHFQLLAASLGALIATSPADSFAQLLKPAQPAVLQTGANTPPPVHRARLGLGATEQPEQAPVAQVAQVAQKSEAKPVVESTAAPMQLKFLSDLITVLSAQKQPIPVNLCFAGVQDFTETEVMQGAAITEGLALRAGYVPLIVSHSNQLERGKFNVLIGTVDQIAPILTATEKQTIKAGWIALRGVPGVSSGPVLIVSGKTEQDLENSIISLGLVREPYPLAASASIRDIILPTAAPFFRREPMHYDTSYTFQQLQDSGVGLTVPPEGGLSLEVFMPGDFPVNGNSEISLQLHYQMKASNFSSASALVVKVNGQIAGQVHGDGGQSAFYGGSGSVTTLPMSAFGPGRNVIEIVPGSTNAAGGGLQVYADSVLTMPKSDYTPTLPDLRISCSTFYPFIGQPDGSNLAVLLSDRKPETMDAAWTLMGKLAQQSNTFLFAAQIGFSQLDPSRHLVVVGEFQSLPEEFRASVPVAAFGIGQLNVPLEQINKAVSGVNLKQVIETAVKKAGLKINHTEDDKVLSQQKQMRESFGYMTSRAPVEGKHGWVFLVTAYSPQQLKLQTYNLVKTEIWSQMKGDLIRWQDTAESVQAHVPGQKTMVIETKQFVEMPFGERINLRIWLIAIGAWMVFFGIATAVMLGKFDHLVHLRQRRL